MEDRLPRKLAAILYADVVGYSRLTGEDEEGTHRQLSAYLDLFSASIEQHQGKVVHYAGDAVLADFSTVTDALTCATTVQHELATLNADIPGERRIQFRIGVNLGEIIEDRNDIYGDGVNVAARLEGLADPGGICISGTVYDSIGNNLGLEYEFMGEQEVKNIAKSVRVYRILLSDDHSRDPSPKTPSGLSDKPIVAVLPFDNMSGDEDQEYFANGITEDVITALTRNRWLSVIAPNSTFAHKSESVDVRRVAAELGAGYIVEGSVRKAGQRVRITAQLVDARSGGHIWAERYDRDLEDIFAVQDEITETISATIEPELGAAESYRVQRKATENLDAWDCYHLGLSHMYKFTNEGNAEAQRLLQRAIEIDPEFGAAHARLSYAIVLNVVYFGAESTPDVLDSALRSAQSAVRLDDKDAVAHFALGRVRLIRGEYENAIAQMRNAIELNPSLAQAHCGLGDALAYSGQLAESLPPFDEAVRLSPHDPYRWGFLMYGSLAYLFQEKFEEAAEWAGKAARVPNSHYWANAALVAALGHLDRPHETESALKELLRREPEFSCGFAKDHLFYIKSKNQIEHYLEGLRKAGLPE
jgi:TolB-like protein/Tfp pilus assembly protein PilF